MPRGLSKPEFVERVTRGAHLWGQPFREALLNEFIKQGLIAPATRGPNLGRKPTYVFGCWHYRRAMQLMRLRAAGIRDSDALFVQLFLRGYRIEIEVFKKALTKESERAAALINAPMRSIYADRGGAIPPKSKAALKAQIGSQDVRFAGGRYEMPPDLSVELVRIARLPPDEDSRSSSRTNISPGLETSARLFEGLLLPADRQSGEKTVIASIVKTAGQKLLMDARAEMAVAIANARREAQLEAQTSDRTEWQAAAKSWWRREFLAMTFIVTLNAVRQNRRYGREPLGPKI